MSIPSLQSRYNHCSSSAWGQYGMVRQTMTDLDEACTGNIQKYRYQLFEYSVAIAQSLWYRR